MAKAPTTYWDYMRLEELTSLQRGLAESDTELANDEVMFITIHQIDELWMKLALRELVSVRDLFAKDVVPEQSIASAVRGMRRMVIVFQQLAHHFALMETMTTRDYLAFRDKLSPASGFQSAQLREIEILMGLDEGARIPLGHESSYMNALRHPDGSESPASRRVARRLEDRPTLKTAIADWLHRTPISGSRPGDAGDDEAVVAFLEAYCTSQAAEVQRAKSFAMHDALSDADRERLSTRFAKK